MKPVIVADLAVVAWEIDPLAGVRWLNTDRGSHEGLAVWFENGWSVSVLCSPHAQCETGDRLVCGTDAEVIVWTPDREPMEWPPGSKEIVLGWQPVESIASLMRMVAKEGRTAD